jgi:hypothetical protein
MTLLYYTSPYNSIPANGSVLFSTTLAGSEAIRAYLTAEELVSIVRAESIAGAGAPDDAASMVSYAHRSFQNLDVIVNDNTISPDNGGITPTDETILLNPGAGTTATVAHEMGHTINWRMHNIAIAPVSFGDYEACDQQPSWSAFSVECERAAFMDGFADFILAIYKWNRSSMSAYQKGYSLAVPDSQCPPNDPNDPNLFIANHQKVGCNTRALWRVYRLNSLGKILKALDSYQVGCSVFFDNHCENERFEFPPIFDNHAKNWYDFWYNWELANGTGLNSITNWAGVHWSAP